MPTGVSVNIFNKCFPAFTSDLKACGGLTVCDIKPANASDLESYFYDTASQKFKVFGALLMADFEMAACGAEQNGLYDLIMMTRRDWSKRLTVTDLDGGLYSIAPFIMGAQKSILNNEYWTVSNGQANGGNWQVDVVSQTGIPADVRWFLERERVFIFGKTGAGVGTQTTWRIVSSTVVSNTVRLVLATENANSNMPAARLGNPTTGFLIRGTGNINDYESWCLESAGLNLNKRIPFWIETDRMALCEDEMFDKWRSSLLKENKYFETFVDVPTVEKNRQLANDYRRKVVNQFFYGKKLANQDLTNYGSLETITSASTGSLALPTESICVGKRANAEGIIEQLWACGRASDLQGQVLNLEEFFNGPLYDISRSRSPGKDDRIVVESFTDSAYAAKIQIAMTKYFDSVSAGNIRFVHELNPRAQNAALGFKFREFELLYPNVVWRVVSHRYFDDRVTAAVAAGLGPAVGRVLWTIDWSDIYQAIIASNRVVHPIGDLNKLAALDSTLACVMKFPSRTYTLTSATRTNVIECPAKHWILENINFEEPEWRGSSGTTGNYYGNVGQAY